MTPDAPGLSGASARQTLCGLVLQSDIDLHQDRPARAADPTDVRVRLGDPVPDGAPLPHGELVLDAADDAGPAYAAVRDPAGRHVLRFPGACDVSVSPDLGTAVISPAVGAAAGLPSVFAAGALVAFQLYLRGALVLHASAVDLGGVAVAVVGHSGMGKSTVAALLCATGGRLVTDDVLRIDDGSSGQVVRLGATELRLRPAARRVVASFDPPPEWRSSADGRHVLRLPDDAGDRVPLGAVVIPRPCRSTTAVEVHRVPPKEALLTLLAFPRLAGWRDPAVVRRQFEATAALARRVPVLDVAIPWGPPFPLRLPGELVAGLGPYLDRGAGPRS